MRWFHPSRRSASTVFLLSALGVTVLLLQSRGSSSGKQSAPSSVVTRGDVVISVGGVGRIVDAQSQGVVALPTGATGAAGTSAPSASAASSAPPGAVFPRASGAIARLLIAPGSHVRMNQAIAVLDDRGIANAAVRQAKDDAASARVELAQKQISDPAKGLPPTAAEIAAANAAIVSARARLARTLGPARPADVAAAKADLGRALADRVTLRGGNAPARRKAIGLARRSVALAIQRIARLLSPPPPADVSAAQADVKKAESDLVTLQTPPPGPSPEAVAAAQQAVVAAQQKLASAQAAGIAPDIAAAQYELAKATADLAALRQPPPAPSAAAVASAQQTIDAAREKLAKVQAPPNPADVTAARLDRQKAENDLATLLAGPNPAVLASADGAVAAAKAKLAQLVGSPLTSDVDAARFDVSRAESDLAILRARGAPASARDIELAKLKLHAANARLANARNALQMLTVRAETAGTVTVVLTARGAPVDPVTPVAAVADLSKLAVTVDLNEFDVARVRRGMAAIVRVDALGGKAFAGRVTAVAATGTNAGGVVTFPVRVELRRVGNLRAGMNVSVRVIQQERRNVVQLPLAAVTRGDGANGSVSVVDSAGRFTKRQVILGIASNDRVEIVRGLSSGERVAVLDAGGQGA